MSYFCVQPFGTGSATNNRGKIALCGMIKVFLTEPTELCEGTLVSQSRTSQRQVIALPEQSFNWVSFKHFLKMWISHFIKMLLEWAVPCSLCKCSNSAGQCLKRVSGLPEVGRGGGSLYLTPHPLPPIQTIYLFGKQ